MRSCLGEDKFDRAARPDHQFGLGNQADRNGVGPAGIGLEPVAGADRHPLGHRAEAIVHYRPDGHQPLGVGHLADAAVFGQRIAHDEQVFVDRFVAGNNRQLADRLGPLAADPQAFDRLEQLGLGIDHGLDPQRAVRPGGLPAVDFHGAAIAGRLLGRPGSPTVPSACRQVGPREHRARPAGRACRPRRGTAMTACVLARFAFSSTSHALPSRAIW